MDSLFGTDQETASGRFARVVLERGIDAPRGLTYSIPASMEDLVVGERVEAPLGRGNTRAEGYVVEITEQADVDPSRLKALTRRVGIRSPGRLMGLASWIAAYYCCPIGMVLSTMIPAAVKRKTGARRRTLLERVTDESGTPVLPEEKLAPSARGALQAVDAMPEGTLPMEPKALRDHLGMPTLAPINRLVRAGILREVEQIVVRAPLFDVPDTPDVRPDLTDAQAAATDAIVASLGRFQPHLLFGVTGSGKTEVYLRSLEAVLARGESAIVLVPEISLTPQTAGRFIRRFGTVETTDPQTGRTVSLSDVVAVLHSGLTASQRHQQWTRIASGEARIAIGARSAIFAPFPDGAARVGMIIVDEEHDSSYKQDQLPRYHARDVALRRGQLEGCPVVLGSATPSLESWSNAARGRYSCLRLPERVGGGELPKVEVVDIAEERRHTPERVRFNDTLGPRLVKGIRDTLTGGGQIILLLNRRGYASYIACPSSQCGWFAACDQCDATLVHHRQRMDVSGRGDTREFTYVQCHHCEAKQRLPRLCPVCNKKLVSLGFGTQRLEEELASRFDDLVLGETMLRLDGDTMRTARDYFDALERFRTGRLRLLMGTQMIAKGLDFPDVRLIGVVNADTAIHLPDFRASERTFQLISQVAGRAGRSASAAAAGARVIVQTLNPSEPSIVRASRHDYEGFAEAELTFRQRVGLPPSGRMVRIVCRDEDHRAATEHARKLRAGVETLGDASIRIRGPMPCPVSRVAGYARIALELTAPTSTPLQRAMAALRNQNLLRSDRRTAVDVDPVTLM